jgi:hypothetical protein
MSNLGRSPARPSAFVGESDFFTPALDGPTTFAWIVDQQSLSLCHHLSRFVEGCFTIHRRLGATAWPTGRQSRVRLT